MFGRSHRLNGGAELSGALRIHTGREQGGADATEHVARARLSRPRRTRHSDEHGAGVGSRDQLGGTLQKHGGASLLSPGSDRSDRILLDPATLLLQQPRQFARMGCQQPARRAGFGR